MKEDSARCSWIPDLSGASGPIYLALADAIQDGIAAGALPEGERLPTHRALAAALDLDLTTVTRAYGEARRRGLVDAAAGRGTFVRGPLAQPPMVEPLPAEIDLSMNLPPQPLAAAIPAKLSQTMAAILRRSDAARVLSYHPSAGGTAERAAAARWLAPLLGTVPPSRVLITAGGQAALMALLTTLAPPRSTVLTEQFTYPGLRAIAAQTGITLEGLPMDGDGLLPEALDAACTRLKPAALYTIPTIQNPTAATMPPARRAAVAEIARHHGLAVIEDDAYGLLPPAPAPPLATFAPDQTWYLGTLSKCLLPALRVAYLVAPDDRCAARIQAALRAVCQMVPPLSAAVATRWVQDGTALRLVEDIRAEAARRQEVARRVLPAGSFAAHGQGHHIWLRLPAGWSATGFTAQARRFGFALVPDTAFAVGPAPDSAVRISLGAAPDLDCLAAALGRIGSLLDENADALPEIV
ncbi:PLP-dependent aminotransferase family protein [Skermanella rosea]|uniref:aminotransferase-like domain-containing protein n=1 Tax=Skermanella rosea TaxID=1817965 RepID=UPI0019335EC1|nr:PLP-dependent aminotransferase family protein [Skermanella rosea]UEM01640.1 PLP-dependent aminotransferase family protein [Skermanella rosea]